MESSLPTRDDHLALLRDGGPLIDVRAPVEFAKGAAPGAVSAPILDDDQRARVGRCFRAQGQAAAVALGHELVSGELRERRVAGWLALARAHPGATLICRRGGLRSQIAQRWLSEAGATLPRVAGGFDALRRAAAAGLAAEVAGRRWFVLGGRTGSGKTDLLVELPHHLDLEGLANHRGSAFGQLPGGQPTTIRFELAVARACLRAAPEVALVVEDESAMIGRLPVPEPIREVIRSAPRVVIDDPLERRIARVLRDYVHEPLARGDAPEALAGALQGATDRIKKRLGGLMHRTVTEQLAAAFASGRDEDHARWIESLLVHYYDPLYDHPRHNQRERVVFQGPHDAVDAFLRKETAAGAAR